MTDCRYWDERIWICTVYGAERCKGKKCPDYVYADEARDIDPDYLQYLIEEEKHNEKT